MLVVMFVACAMVQATSTTVQTVPLPAPAPQAAQRVSTPGGASELINVKRIYVDSFGEDLISKEMQSMIVSSLVETKRFKVTENRERADAVLKGVALEKTSQELHAYGESTSVGAASGGGHSEISGTGGTVSAAGPANRCCFSIR